MKVSIIGITNDIRFVEMLDARVRSSLGEEEIVFPPYNAEQLNDILSERAREAFYPEAIKRGVISYCAALAAREHGDARRALDLLRVAGEIAEREGSSYVDVEHVKKAWIQIERNRAKEIVSSLPLHARLVLKAILEATKDKPYTTTGELYEVYTNLAKKIGIEVVTQRRISDILSELDMLGIISAQIISRGRYGKTRIIKLSVDETTVVSALEEVSREKQQNFYHPNN